MRQKGRFIIFPLIGLFAAICLFGGVRAIIWAFQEKLSLANESISGNVFEDWVMPDLGTIAQIDIADIGAGSEPELVICGGNGLYVFARTEKGYINRWRNENIKVLPYDKGRIFVLFDFDDDGTGELAFKKDNNLQLLNYRDGIFLESVIARDINVRDMVAGRFFPGKAASLAVLTRDGVKMVVPGSPNTFQEILNGPDIVPTRSGGGKLAVLSGTKASGDILLIAGNSGKVYFYHHGSGVKSLNLGEEDIIRLETWDAGDAQGQYLILQTGSGIKLYSWSNGTPRLLWEKKCRDESNAILVDLDGRNGPELVFMQSEFDYEKNIVKGSVRVYGITGDKLHLQWDSGNIKARQVASVDLNGDQLRELAVGVDNGARCSDTRKGRVELYGLTGSGRDGNWHRIWQGDNYEEGEFTLASGKLDGDGAEEMVVGNSGICDNKGTVRVFKTGSGIKKPFITSPKIDCNIEQNEIITDQSNLNLRGTVDMESQVSLVFNGEISPVTVSNNSFAVILPLREGINKLEIHAASRAKGSTLMKYLVSRVKKEGHFYIPPWDDDIHLEHCLTGDTDGDGVMEVIAGDDSGRLNLFKFEHGKIKFFAQSDRSQGSVPKKIVDCNRNGFKEIYVSKQLILEWDGRQYNRINIPEDAGFTHFGDINGDGIIDLISEEGVVYTWRGNTVVELARFTTPERGFVAVGDLDKDEIAEVITAEYIEDDYDPRPDSGITVQKWNGTGFTDCITLKSGFGITHLNVLDMDGDGKEEVCAWGEVFGSEKDEDENGPNRELRLFKWHGKELVREQHFPKNFLRMNDPKSGDLDGNGRPELLTYIFDKQKKIKGMVIIRFKDGLPTMKNFVFPTANSQLDNITLGDVDNDGKEEIIEASGALKVYKWDGNKAVLVSKYP